MNPVAWSQQALNALVDLAARDRRQAHRIVGAVYRLAETGEGDIRKLQGGQAEWRLRVGDWRVIYVRGASGSPVVLTIELRRDAYP